MKKHLQIVALATSILFATSFNLLSQNTQSVVPAPVISKTEEFQTKDGMLLQKQYKHIGNMKTKYDDLRFRTLTLVDLISKAKVEALILSIQTTGSKYVDPEEITATVDADELTGLLKAIDIIQKDILTMPVPLEYTEVIFTSRGGFRAGVFSDSKKNKWSFFMHLSKYKSGSSVFMDTDKIPELVESIKNSGLVK